jgi:hypothetical protein
MKEEIDLKCYLNAMAPVLDFWITIQLSPDDLMNYLHLDASS